MFAWLRVFEELRGLHLPSVFCSLPGTGSWSKLPEQYAMMKPLLAAKLGN
jgi:hypothetical protein